MSKNTKTLKLGWLEGGDRFEIPSLSETMRNLTVISTNESSTNVEGEKRDSIHDTWKHFRFPISNDVNVLLLEKGAPKLSNKPESKILNKPESTEQSAPRRRGRPAKRSTSLSELDGVKGDFTVKELTEKNDIKEYEAHNLVRSAVKSGKLKIVKEISGGRGKPKKVYRLA